MRTIATMLMACLLVTVTAFTAYATDKENAVSLVRAAISYYQSNGLEKTIEEISNQNGKFRNGSLYVFVYDVEGTMIAHPDNGLMGLNLLNTPDAKGKKFRKEIIERAKNEGTGWVDYVYLNKTSKKNEDKTTYFEKSGDLVFCCGIYRPMN